MKKIQKELSKLYDLACEKICKAIIATNKPFVLTDSKYGGVDYCDTMYGYVFDIDDISARELEIKGLLLKDNHLFVVLDLFEVHYTEDDLAELIKDDLYMRDEVYDIYDGKRLGSSKEILCCQTIISIIDSIDQYLDIE